MRNVLAVLIGALLITLSGSALSVQAVASPPLSLTDARCVRSIVQTDDALCIARYNLPQQTTIIPTPVSGTPEAWCLYLQINTGCSTDPVSPTDPASLQYGVLSAWVTVCSLGVGDVGCIPDPADPTGVIYAQVRPPRIHYGLAGVYFQNTGAGGFTWGDSSVNMCVESSDDFAPMAHACAPVSFNGAANTQIAQRNQLSADLIAMLIAIGQSRNLPDNAYVSNNKILSGAAVLALEAYPYMDRIIPDAFQAASAAALQTPYTGIPAGVVVLQTRLAATAAAADFLHPDTAGVQLLGISGTFYSTLLWMGGGLIIGYIAFRITASIPITIISFGAIAFLGVFTGGPTTSVIGVVIIILGMIGGWFALSKAPSG